MKRRKRLMGVALSGQGHAERTTGTAVNKLRKDAGLFCVSHNHGHLDSNPKILKISLEKRCIADKYVALIGRASSQR
jgi:hypothetical protein